MTIQDIIARLGRETDIFIGRSRLYHYDKIGLLPIAERLENGYRTFSEEDYLNIKFIVIAAHLKVPLKHVQAHFKGDSSLIKLDVHKKSTLIDQLTNMI